MDFNELLALDLIDGNKILQEKGYTIGEINYLNSSPGSLKIVRVKNVSLNKVELVVSYHNDPLIIEN